MEETMGQRLARLRKAARLDQLALAKALDIPQSMLSMVENERRAGEKLTVKVAAGLADVLGVSLDYLVRGKEAKRASRQSKAPAVPPRTGEVV